MNGGGLMRSSGLSIGLIVASLLSVPAMLAQTNPPPPDPHEMVTHEPRTLTKKDDRAAAQALLDQARLNFDLRAITTPYALKISFETNGATTVEGKGTLEEYSDGAGHRMWTAQLGNWNVVRVVDGTHVFSTNPAAPIPLRIQMIRNALQAPIRQNAGTNTVREAKVTRDGKAMVCLLSSLSLPSNPAPRSWFESEYCLDPDTGILQTWSETPGIYAVYDYTGSANFHGHTFPKKISLYEEGRLATEVSLESLEDEPNLDADFFKPTADMIAAGESFSMSVPGHLPLRVDPSNAPTSSFYQPVIVHAILDAQDGHVIDAEALQNSYPDLSAAALELIKNSAFPDAGQPGIQHEAFINVQFHMPAGEFRGVGVGVGTRVRWVIVAERRAPPPKKKPKI
jgi:hypothetical protein